MNKYVLIACIVFISCHAMDNQYGEKIRVKNVSDAEFKANSEARLAAIKEKMRLDEAILNPLCERDFLDVPVRSKLLLNGYIKLGQAGRVLDLLKQDKVLRLFDPLARNLFGVYDNTIDSFTFDQEQYSYICFDAVKKVALELAEQGKNFQFLANYWQHNASFADDLLPPEELTFSY